MADRVVQQTSSKLKALGGVEHGLSDRHRSDVTDDRRGIGGRLRRAGDGWSPPSLVACPDCGTGTAQLVAFIKTGQTANYRCRACLHSFRITGP
jgi:hypothetical protein